MGDRTSIEWADASWNPLIGCSKVSEGCDHCYAVGVAHRGMSPQHRGLTVATDRGVDWNGQINVAESMFDRPLRWARPRRIFVNSLSDLFHPGVTDATICRVFAVMATARQHTFQVLTKRPQRMAKLLSQAGFAADVDAAVAELADSRGAIRFTPLWPLPNVWLGTSIEADKYVWRADHVRATPAAVRWVSAEPLLGPLPSLDLADIDWIVVGGESGPGARPMHLSWVRDLRDRCIDEGKGPCPTCDGDGSVPVPGGAAACGHCYVENTGGTGRDPVAFLFKQHGAWAPAPWKLRREPGEPVDAYKARSEKEAATHSLGPWPGSFQKLDHQPWSLERADNAPYPHQGIRLVGKTKAGRVLDGRTWDGYPE